MRFRQTLSGQEQSQFHEAAFDSCDAIVFIAPEWRHARLIDRRRRFRVLELLFLLQGRCRLARVVGDGSVQLSRRRGGGVVFECSSSCVVCRGRVRSLVLRHRHEREKETETEREFERENKKRRDHMQFNQTTLDRLWRDPNRLSMPTLHTAGLTGGRRRRRGDAIQDTTRGWPSWKRAFAVGHHSSIPNGGRPPFESEIGPASSLRRPPMQTSNSTSCCRRMEICCGKMGGRSAMEPWELSSKKMQKKRREKQATPSFPFLATSQVPLHKQRV